MRPADAPAADASDDESASRIDDFAAWVSIEDLSSDASRQSLLWLRDTLNAILRQPQPAQPPAPLPPRPTARDRHSARTGAHSYAPKEACVGSPHSGDDDIWIFGYGSILWRPGFAFERAVVGYVNGFARRFHLGDESHRGVSGSPGRAVTLEPYEGERCWGCAFLLPAGRAGEILKNMDRREKMYSKRCLDLYSHGSNTEPAVRDVVAYVVTDAAKTDAATCYLGPADAGVIAKQIVSSRGPSGRNVDYLVQLADWLDGRGVVDDHVADVLAEARKFGFLDKTDLDAPAGTICVDDGAAEVLSNCARSLLAVGVTSIDGSFQIGAVVAVVDARGGAVARGRVLYSADDLRKIAGSRSAECFQLVEDHIGEPGVVVDKKDMVLA